MSDFSLLSLLKTSLHRTIEGTHPFAVGSLHVELYIKINKTEKSIVYNNYIHILNRNESGRFGALKSDSTHHFFRNVCTKSGSLRFSVFRLLTDFVCLYNYEFWLSLCKIVRSSVILVLPLFTVKHARAKWHGAKENKRGMKQETNDFLPRFPFL